MSRFGLFVTFKKWILDGKIEQYLTQKYAETLCLCGDIKPAGKY